MKVSKEFLKAVLETLYKVHPHRLGIRDLSKHIMNKNQVSEEIQGVCLYLQGKGLIEKFGGLWRITAQGIDKLEGGSLI